MRPARREGVRIPGDGVRFVASSAVTLVGDGATVAVMAIAATMSGYSASQAGVLLAAAAVPKCVLLLWGGLAGDRFDRRGLMIWCYLIAAAAQIGSGVLMMGHGSLVLLALAQVIFGSSVAFARPAASAYLPTVTPSEALARANALLTGAASLSATVGPLIATVFVAAGCPEGALILDGATFVGAALLLRGLPASRGQGKTAVSGIEGITEGLRGLRAVPWLVREMWCSALLLFLVTGPFLVLGPAAVAELGSPATWTLSLTVFGLGQLGGAFLAGEAGAESATLFRSAVFLPVLALPPIIILTAAPGWAFAVAEGAVGVSLGYYHVSVVTAMQHAVPKALLARVSSVNALVSFSLLPLSFLLAPVVAEQVGNAAVFAVAAGAAPAVGLLLLASAGVRRYQSPATSSAVTDVSP